MPPLKPIFDQAVAYLAKREHSTMELRRKLQQKGYAKPDIEYILVQLIEKNHLNDARYAEARARTRAHNSKWGASKIRQELAAQGVDKTTAASTLTGLNETEDWLTTAATLLTRKFSKPLPPEHDERQKEKQRRLAFLIRRGFSFEQAAQALANTLKSA